MHFNITLPSTHSIEALLSLHIWGPSICTFRLSLAPPLYDLQQLPLATNTKCLLRGTDYIQTSTTPSRQVPPTFPATCRLNRTGGRRSKRTTLYVGGIFKPSLIQNKITNWTTELPNLTLPLIEKFKYWNADGFGGGWGGWGVNRPAAERFSLDHSAEFQYCDFRRQSRSTPTILTKKKRNATNFSEQFGTTPDRRPIPLSDGPGLSIP